MRCVFTEGGVKCGDRIIPASKYCRKHILEDKKQVLFRACNIEKAGVICKEPVPGIFEDTTCILHIQLPPQRNYAQKKYESDSDDETTSEPNLSSNIKKEEVNSADTEVATVSEATTMVTATETTVAAAVATPAVTVPSTSPIVPKIETKEKPVEVIAPTDETDQNVTICHNDISDQKPDENEIKTELSEIQPMEH